MREKIVLTSSSDCGGPLAATSAQEALPSKSDMVKLIVSRWFSVGGIARGGGDCFGRRFKEREQVYGVIFREGRKVFVEADSSRRCLIGLGCVDVTCAVI